MTNPSLKLILILAVIGLAGCATRPTVIMVPVQEAQANVTPATGTLEPPPPLQQPPQPPAAPTQTIQDLPPTADTNMGSTSIGGAVEQAMDEVDKSKMLHAMDKSPGKSTHWVNARTGIEYTVTPTRKVQVEDKNYCRQYRIIAVGSNQKEQSVQGIACIASDGNWHILQT